jgi:hypothetical protein
MSETITISAARLQELEAMEAKIKAKNEKDTLRIINYDKEHPGAAAVRSKRCKERHREEYNARRRELYRLKKENGYTPVDATTTE